MNTTVVKVVIDTNILIAIIPKKSPFRWVFDAIIKGKIQLCISSEILLEYQEILALKNGKEVAENVVNLIAVHPLTLKVDIFYNFNLITQDPDDNKFVDCAIAGDALCLVSNDKHFAVLKSTPFPKVNWLILAEFEEKYKTILTS